VLSVRFGFPVYPERELGIPSSSGPVSFAGFTPAASVASSLNDVSVLSAATVDARWSQSGVRKKKGPIKRLFNFAGKF